VLAPRQPRRFQAVADLLRAQDLVFRRGSEAWPDGPEPWAGTPILLLDTLGELASAYREGTLALVGGGWAWNGGHNPLEPVVWGVPTLIGPGFDNFRDLVEPLLEAGLVRVVPAGRLGDEVAAVLALGKWRPAEDPGTRRLPEALAGALEKTWKSVSIVIPTPR
jgi:3-deoxy-D-manno-octulosonic-acid transferase